MPSLDNLKENSDSVYANELRRRARRLRFSATLEAEYVVRHLQRVRLRVRMWFSVAVVLISFFSIGEIRIHGARTLVSLLNICVLLPCSVTLAWLPWSRHYERFYMPVARALVPLFGTLIVILIARTIVDGQQDTWTALPLHLIAVFLFSGLMFTDAILTSVAMLIGFSGAASILGLPQDLLLKGMFVLTLTCAMSALVYWDIESFYRASFLEGKRIGELAIRDGLSGLMNRRAFDEHLARVWRQALREHHPIAVLMIDIDHFKLYNDASGHQAGDAALRAVAEILRGSARRPLDLASRYGGEEFALVLYNVSMKQVQELSERIRLSVQNARIPRAPGAPEQARVTVSVGAGCVIPTPGRTPQGTVQLADEALYEAKHAGRNRVAVKGPDDHRLLRTGVFKSPVTSSLT